MPLWGSVTECQRCNLRKKMTTENKSTRRRHLQVWLNFGSGTPKVRVQDGDKFLFMKKKRKFSGSSGSFAFCNCEKFATLLANLYSARGNDSPAHLRLPSLVTFQTTYWIHCLFFVSWSVILQGKFALSPCMPNEISRNDGVSLENYCIAGSTELRTHFLPFFSSERDPTDNLSKQNGDRQRLQMDGEFLHMNTRSGEKENVTTSLVQCRNCPHLMKWILDLFRQSVCTKKWFSLFAMHMKTSA